MKRLAQDKAPHRRSNEALSARDQDWVKQQIAKAPKLSPERWKRVAAILGGR